jgi:hypothetical protein
MSTDTKDDLVTEEMVHAAAECIDHPSVYMGGPREQSKRTAARVLRAVAPMMRKLAVEQWLESRQATYDVAKRKAIAAEREACAQIAEGTDPALSDTPLMICTGIAAAIRARGET